MNNNLQGMLSRLLGELEVTQVAWQGNAGRQFQAVKSQWSSDQQAIQQALLQTAEAIRTSGKTYDASDANASSRMTGLNQGGMNLPL